jgi:broad specificity phosphatase PhoE
MAAAPGGGLSPDSEQVVVSARPVLQGRRMETLVWARHGENVANLTRTLSYRVFDGELTPAGRRQAAELAGCLAASRAGPVGRIVCSPLRRARQTAEIVAERLRLPVAAEFEDLRELNVGDLDGRSDAQAWQTYTAVVEAWRAGDEGARFPGGEDCAELCRRLLRALSAVAAMDSASGGRTLIVAHGGALRAALPALTGGQDPGSDMPTGSVAVLQLQSPGTAPPVRLLSWPVTR